MTRIDVSQDGYWYIVTFFENGVEEDVKTNEEKGWKVTTGFLEGEAVPIRAYYRQDMYTLDDVKKFAENLRECPICQRLGQDMSIQSINVENNYQRAQPAFGGTGMGLNRRPQPTSPISDTGNMFMDTLFNALIDTTLTPLGKIMTAKMLDNDAMLENALPHSDDDAVEIVAGYLSSDSPKDMIFKSPDEMKTYAKALRAGITPEEDEKEEETKTPVFRRQPTMVMS
jgi:hypothetical protein